MINIILKHNKGFKWHSSNGIFIKGKGFVNGELYNEEELIFLFENIQTESDFKEALSKINGIFCVIISCQNKVLASVDKLRTFPLLYHFDNETFTLTDDYESYDNLIVNEAAKKSMLALGFVPGRETLIKKLFQLQAGEYLSFTQHKLTTNIWHRCYPLTMDNIDKSEWKIKLKKHIYKIGERLYIHSQNRPVALPLSGGFDSRLIALLLKLQRHNNVLCFTYGNRSNIEAKKSEEIAKRLGLPWQFIDYSQFIGEDYIHTSQFQEYTKFMGNAMTFPFLQEYFAARYLKDKLSKETLFIPGHSGDMIGGSHLFPDMEFFKSKKELSKKILRKNQLLIPLNKKYLNFVNNQIVQNLNFELYNYSHLAHDEWNIRERQSKQIINSSKVWDYFGFQYYLPLWDDDFTNLLLSLPFKQRVFKNLYDEVLKELFIEHNILLPDEFNSLYHQKYSYIKMRIKTHFPFISKFKKKNFFDFFYHKELLVPMINELEKKEYEMYNGIITDWYIQTYFNNNQ